MLKGERVLLRPMKLEDAARQHQFDQDVSLYGMDSDTPHVRTQANTQDFIESRLKGDPDYAAFAIEVEGIYIGHCALYHLQDRNRNAELGITIGDPAYWGQGYGRETVKLLLRYAFHYLNVRRVELTTNAKNERAIRSYLACGFVEEGRPRKVVWIEGEYTDLVNMSILRDEWAQLQS
jgi:RimJ/RimL family protein N-acetyltransferase